MLDTGYLSGFRLPSYSPQVKNNCALCGLWVAAYSGCGWLSSYEEREHWGGGAL